MDEFTDRVKLFLHVDVFCRKYTSKSDILEWLGSVVSE